MCLHVYSNDTPPAWLRKHTKASFRISTYDRRRFTEGELIAGAIVTEVSVLSPGVKPAEPLAQVLTFHPTEKPLERTVSSAARIPTSDRLAAGETEIYCPPGVVLRRPGGAIIGVR